MKNPEVNYYCLADTHFSHDKMVTAGIKSANEDEKVINSVHTTVGDNDTLLHIGDVSFYKDAEWHTRLWEACAGKMILVRGNHDKKSLTWYYTQGWDFVCDEFRLNIYGKRLIFSHKPLESIGNWDINIHGHWHNKAYYKYKELTDNYRLINQCKLVNLRTVIGK